MSNLARLVQIADSIGMTSIPGNMLELMEAVYVAGRADAAGDLAVTLAIPQAPWFKQPGAPAVSPRQQRLTDDLSIGRSRRPQVDFDKPVMLKRTAYKIVGYNANAPKHEFIIEGPQGGRYKCPLDMVLNGQH